MHEATGRESKVEGPVQGRVRAHSLGGVGAFGSGVTGGSLGGCHRPGKCGLAGCAWLIDSSSSQYWEQDGEVKCRGPSLFSHLKLYYLLCSHRLPSPHFPLLPSLLVKMRSLGPVRCLEVSSQNPYEKSDTIACICNPSSPMVGWDMKTGEPPGSQLVS